MPFRSKAQWRQCFAEKRRNPNSSWNCIEWAHESPPYQELPDRIKGGNLRSEEARSLSNHDIESFFDGQIKILKYSQLRNFKSIDDLLKPYGRVIILYESKPGYGHWVGLFRYPHSDVIEFFDSYGMFPDHERHYIKPDFREASQQEFPELSKLLMNYPGPIEYNDFPFKK